MVSSYSDITVLDSKHLSHQFSYNHKDITSLDEINNAWFWNVNLNVNSFIKIIKIIHFFSVTVYSLREMLRLQKWVYLRDFQVAQWVKNLPVVQETWVWSLGWEASGGANGNPFQYSCLGNPIYREAWQATVHRVLQSQTRRKRLITHACIYTCDVA